jgi:hypothetical protein
MSRPDPRWTEALRKDGGVRLALESSVFTSSVVGMAICGADGRVVVAASQSQTDCPEANAASEIRSVNTAAWLFGPPRSFMLSRSLGMEGSTLRVYLSSLLIQGGSQDRSSPGGHLLPRTDSRRGSPRLAGVVAGPAPGPHDRKLPHQVDSPKVDFPSG